YKTAMQLYNLHEQLATTVEQLNEKQRLLNANTGQLKDSASRKLLEEYNQKLEELRSTLLATKQKSIFADEKKLREEISEVYIAVAGQEARPSNLQVQRIAQLQQQVMKAEENRMSLWKQYNARVDAALAKEGLPMKEGEKPSKVF
ncbi:MAG TPA: hypothetical protein VHK91_16085, partial [Flavisolibacter sp.]|nr:hypothetical protein [Flavisolibacter sp.]